MREIVLEARAVTRTYGTGTGATHALRGVDEIGRASCRERV